MKFILISIKRIIAVIICYINLSYSNKDLRYNAYLNI
uniref:Uncharacterized protein n=1 Tax=Chondria sp. (in: red algae) TaxID=1982705 RepID=A0A1Z1MDN1_9FLOR|nr:hypothetical protein [Chondria sp. (in: red algae)]